MVSNCSGVKAHGIHQFHFQEASHDDEIGGSLAEVTGMQKKDVLSSVSSAHAVDVRGPFESSALPVYRAYTFRLYMAVSVVQMKSCAGAL